MNKIKMILDAAANAPHEIPEWFEADVAKRPKMPEKEAPDQFVKLIADWHKDPCFELYQMDGEKIPYDYEYDEEAQDYLPRKWHVITKQDCEFLLEYQSKWERYYETISEWEKYRDQEKYFQWRIFYAQELFARVLEAIDKEDFEGVA